MKKRVIVTGFGLLMAAVVMTGFLVVWFSASAQDAIMKRVVASNVGGNEAVLDEDALHVVLCGTGSPMPDPDRAQACAIVYAGGKVFLVDSGLGGWDRLARFQLPVGGLTGILITHFHSDHISGIPRYRAQQLGIRQARGAGTLRASGYRDGGAGLRPRLFAR